LEDFGTSLLQTNKTTGEQPVADGTHRRLGHCVFDRGREQPTFNTKPLYRSVGQCSTKDIRLGIQAGEVLPILYSCVVHARKVRRQVDVGCTTYGTGSLSCQDSLSSQARTTSRKGGTACTTSDGGEEERDGFDAGVFDLLPQRAVLGDERGTQLFILGFAKEGLDWRTQSGTRLFEAS
jgi:hypothetical protein